MFKQSRTSLLFVILMMTTGVTAQSPRSALDFLKRGNEALANGEWASAVNDFTLAIQINSGDKAAETSKQVGAVDCAEIATSDDFNACAFCNRGLTHYRSGNLDKAIADFDRALRINPRLADAYNNRGNVWQAKGDLDKALTDFDQAIKLNPRHCQAFNNRANLRQSRNDFSGAINDYSRSIELDSTNATVFANLGLTLIRLGRNDEASLNFNRALMLSPTMKDKLEELIKQERSLYLAKQ